MSDFLDTLSGDKAIALSRPAGMPTQFGGQFSVVVVGERPGQQLAAYDINRIMPRQWKAMDSDEQGMWDDLLVSSGMLPPDSCAEDLLAALEKNVEGFAEQGYTVRQEVIGAFHTVNLEARYATLEKPEEYPNFFLHTDGSRRGVILKRDWDLEEQRDRRERQAHRRYTEFEYATVGVVRPPKIGRLVRRQIERGMTFSNALHEAKKQWFGHPWVLVVMDYKGWGPDIDEPWRTASVAGLARELFKDGDPWEAFCQGYPDPRAEYVRRVRDRAGMPIAYVKDSVWHDWREYEGGPARSGDPEKDFMPWQRHVSQLFEDLPPATRLSAYFAGPWVF